MIPICSRDVIECMATGYHWVLSDYVEREEAEREEWWERLERGRRGRGKKR